jgi:hypothetical protein
LQPLSIFDLGEDNASQLRAIESAVGQQQLLAEVLGNFLQGRHARLDHRSTGEIRVHHVDAQLGEPIRCRALTAANTTRKTDKHEFFPKRLG